MNIKKETPDPAPSLRMGEEKSGFTGDTLM